MRTLATLLVLTLFTGCVANGAPASETAAYAAPTPASTPPAGELYHGKHNYDAPPVSEIEVKEKALVQNGTSKLSYKISWSSASGAAATIPGGAAVKLKDPTGATRAKSQIGPGPLPAASAGTVELPPGGTWIVEYEGYAPGVSASVILTSA